MSKLFRQIVFVIIVFSGTACNAERIQVGSEKAENATTANYLIVLGRPVADQQVTDFIASNNCSAVSQIQMCKDKGMALWIDSSQTVQTVYLYLNNADDFSPYKGKLPFGLKFYDTMGAVEYKLKRQGVGSAGLPDSGGTPDHLHYWANYEQVNMTIVYNSPSPEDEDATIYAILVNG